MPTARPAFTRETFAALLRSESLRCLRTSVARGWIAPVPEAVLYYLSHLDRRIAWAADDTAVTVPSATLLTEEELLPHLFRDEDGHFRGEIVLAPFAATEAAAVIDVTIRVAEWTDTVFAGEQAFPHEPFQLHGPALPPSWRTGDPTPCTALPRLRTGDVAGTASEE
jgi:hypothetical protein